MQRLVTNQRGMTVAEVLVAVAIIGTGLVALSAAVPFAAYGIQEGNQLSTATFLANQRMEQVRNAPWQESPAKDCLGVSAVATAAPVAAAGCGAANTVTFPDEVPAPVPYANYNRTVRVTDCNVAPGCSGIVNADLRQVTVSVSYRPMTGIGVAAATRTKSAVLTMYITKR